MGKIVFSPAVYLVLRVGIGGIFLYSGASKALDLNYFSGIIDAFGILPSSLCFPAAIGIVTLELMLGAGTVFNLRGSLMGILAMLLGFMGVAGYAIHMGYDIDCGCFGPGDPAGEAFSGLRIVLYRDAAMVAAIAYLYAWRHRHNAHPESFVFSLKPKTN